VDELDELTLLRAKRGDRRAQGELVRKYQGRVHQLLSRLLVAHPEVVDDVLQDSLLKALRALAGFDPRGPAKLSTWILTIATRAGIDALRKHARIHREVELEMDQDGPEELFSARELSRRVKRAMADLPDDHRAVLVLRAYHDLDYPEIAEALGIEIGTVKSRLSRARAALKAALGEEKDLRHG
jgi:RNA polymerase sigma-70 factor (ECF subfamily)